MPGHGSGEILLAGAAPGRTWRSIQRFAHEQARPAGRRATDPRVPCSMRLLGSLAPQVLHGHNSGDVGGRTITEPRGVAVCGPRQA